MLRSQRARPGRIAVVASLVAIVAAGATYAILSRPETEPPTEPGVLLCRYNQFSQSTEQREQGFLQTMQNEFPHINVLASVQYLGTTRETSVRRARQLFETFGDSVRGIFCVCEPNGDGMLQVLVETDRAGKIPFVSCDANAAMIAALKDGKMAGIVLQDPVKMGRETVETMLAHLRGEEVTPRVQTGQHLATSDNMESDRIRPLLYPDRFGGETVEPTDPKFTIAVVTKGLTHEFWQSVRAGAEKAARDAGDVAIRFEAPTLEQDLAGQIELFRRLIAERVSGICISPIDSEKLVPLVIKAKAKGIPTVVFDSGLNDEALYDGESAKVSYVATNNYEVGAIAARRLAEALDQSPGRDPATSHSDTEVVGK
ncbi:D-allose-binding periplasmic protein precursor [Planctomycetes bacterium MalM25]|nr:D-allose-binding periplasmic protein precursor [Planctomycetes bacterium MalM25]